MWENFKNNPDVFVHPEKEIYFFNMFYDKGLNWYKQQFETNKKIIIDTTPDYFTDHCAKKIIKTLPDSKIIVCLRNPIERAYSHWKFGIFMGNCRDNFIKSWEKDWNNSKTMGLYDRHLTSYLDHFRLNETLLVLFYDDIKKNHIEFVEKIFNYLNVNTSKPLSKKVIPGSKGFEEHFGKNKSSRSKSNKEQLYNSFHESNIISKNDYNLVLNYYFKSIDNLEKLLDINLSHWKLEYKEFVNAKNYRIKLL